MKKKCHARMTACLAALLTLTFAGCLSHTSPYDYVENWLIREDPVRTFVIPADLIYVQGDMYTKLANVHMMQDYARVEVGQGKFSGLARVFSPLIASSEDLEDALDWYFKYHHRKGRPFIFIGEGEGGLPDFVQDGKNGLVFDPSAPDRLVAAFDRLVSMPQDRIAQMLAIARATAEGHAWPNVIAGLMDIYDEVRATV